MVAEIELNFDNLNSIIVAHFENNDDSLSEAKELFAPFIDSTRQLEKVRDIQQLLALLKRRGLYSQREFNTFRIFQKIIVDENYASLVTRHQELLQSSPNDTESLPTQIYGNRNVRNEIFNIISYGISLDEFRRLARHLDLTREEIMDIEHRCNDYHTQNLVLLSMYEQRNNSMRRLLKVLKLIERPDLESKITEIMNRGQ